MKNTFDSTGNELHTQIS